MKLKQGTEIVLAIGDMHYPFAHPDCVPFLKAIKKKYKPTQVVCMGDELDSASLSNYDINPDGLSPGDELAAAIEGLQDVYAEFPNVKVCESNHTVRVYKRAFKSGIPKAFLKSYRDFLEAPKGWEWAERWEIDDVIYEHGEPHTGRNAAIQATMLNMQSTVIGHVHSFGGVQYFANYKQSIFGFNVGCLIDNSAYAFDYAKMHKAKPTLGAGIINKGVPEFIPMILDKNGRWTGKL